MSSIEFDHLDLDEGFVQFQENALRSAKNPA